MEKVLQQVVQPLATFTRPNDTNAYADGDVVADVTANPPSIIKFPNACGEGGGGVILSATLGSSALPGTKLSADLWLFDEQPANNWAGDNAAFALNDADVDKVVGVIALDGTAAGNIKVSTANYIVNVQGLAIAFSKKKAAQKNEDRTLYGVLVARNAYTPAAQEVFTLKLGIQKS